jgi:GT2 family glycosyltransferase
VYGNIEYTRVCLDSLLKKSKLIDEIIIIDNKPDHDTYKALAELYPQVSFYLPTQNLGVSVSWDLGIKLAKNNIVCVSNNDIELIVDNWDEKILEEWSQYENALAFCPWPANDATEDLSHIESPYNGLNGSCFFVDKLGLQLTDNYKLLGQYIDHRFEKAYWEDCDLLAQIRKIDKESYVSGKTKIVHFGNKTAGSMLPSDKGMHNPYWRNLDQFNKKYGTLIWDFFKVNMSNVLDERTDERII